MATDPTVLHTQALALLAVLEDKAAEMGWEPNRHCVTNGPPSVECDSIFVWADSIFPQRDQAGPKCHVVLRSRFQYVIAACVGTVACDDTGAAQMHDTAWGMQAGLIQAVLAGELCADPCTYVRFGEFTLLTNDGGYSWWQGSIQIDLSPEELAS